MRKQIPMNLRELCARHQSEIALLIFGLCLLVAFSCGKQQPSQKASSEKQEVFSEGPASRITTEAEQDLGPFTVKVPSGWKTLAPSSSMRKAEYELPKVDTDAEDASLAVFYFGSGQGGSVEANIERWAGQFAQPDGSSSKEKTKVTKKTVSDFPVILVDLSGTYQAPITPMSQERYNKPDYRMLAAVVETPEGAFFFKLVGPQKTVANWDASFDEFIGSIKSK